MPFEWKCPRGCCWGSDSARCGDRSITADPARAELDAKFVIVVRPFLFARSIVFLHFRSNNVGGSSNDDNVSDNSGNNNSSDNNSSDNNSSDSNGDNATSRPFRRFPLFPPPPCGYKGGSSSSPALSHKNPRHKSGLRDVWLGEREERERRV